MILLVNLKISVIYRWNLERGTYVHLMEPLMKQTSTVMMEYLKLLNTYKDPIKLGKY